MEEIDLKEIIGIFLERKTTIILMILIFMVLGFIYSAFLVTPKYSSYTKLLLAQTSISKDTSAITTTDITINSKLLPTYRELIKGKGVVRQVISNLDLDASEEEVKNSIEVTSETNTDIIRITVTDTDPETAADIANEIAKVFPAEVKRLYSIDNVNVVEAAEVSTSPSNINHVKTIILFGAVGFVISVAYIFITYMLDNSIKSQEDIEKSMNIPVLASIPVYQTEGMKNSSSKNKSRKKTTKGGKRR